MGAFKNQKERNNAWDCFPGLAGFIPAAKLKHDRFVVKRVRVAIFINVGLNSIID
jgi:hypothetical protein